RCNHCVPHSVGGSCTTSVKECDEGDYVCVFVVFPQPMYSFFRRCSKRSDALIMQTSPHLNVVICETDRCN
uniref:UPAR/Ly6 domain-containing protein n=1 Tax=Labrus bergylta TaxID=56723 RepID=A0A3Q3G202_9LABR